MWPPEALEFLRDLEANNDADWFRAQRRRYDAYLLAPARELAEKFDDLGRPHFFRPYNNLRFRPGPPLKEHLGVAIGYGAAGGFYFELSLDGLLVAAGLHRPATDQLERFRAAVDDERRARGFTPRPGHRPPRRPYARPSQPSNAPLGATRRTIPASTTCAGASSPSPAATRSSPGSTNPPATSASAPSSARHGHWSSGWRETVGPSTRPVRA